VQAQRIALPREERRELARKTGVLPQLGPSEQGLRAWFFDDFFPKVRHFAMADAYRD
jgi:hypothetical protein